MGWNSQAKCLLVRVIYPHPNPLLRRQRGNHRACLAPVFLMPDGPGVLREARAVAQVRPRTRPALNERNQPLAYRVQNCFSPVPCLHLSHDVGYVACDRVVANAKLARHVFVAVSGRDKPGHL